MIRGRLILAVVFVLAVRDAWSGTFQLEGEPVQGGMMLGVVDPGCEIEFDGRRVSVGADGGFVIGFKHDNPPWAALHVRCRDGLRRRQFLPVRQRTYDEQHIDGLPEDMVSPDEATLERIRADAARVRDAREMDSGIRAYRSPLIWPVRGAITGVFGSRRVLNGEPRRPHFGIDVAAAVGTPVKAAAGGVVTLAAELYLSGNTVIIDHGHGVNSSYLHLDRIDVGTGDDVSQGQVIGTVGASGRVTGAHLDWRLNWYQTRLDPALAAGPMSVD